MGKELQGEGNYDAAREYDEAVTKHAKDQTKVEAEARDADEALEGPEREQLDKAEAVNSGHAGALPLPHRQFASRVSTLSTHSG